MSRRERWVWGIVAAVALGLRLAYVVLEAGTDPAFGRPALDEGVYLAWARGLASGAGQPPGAFYLAPLYPNLLSAWLAVAGERLAAWLVLQQALAVATAGVLAWTARRLGGRTAAAWTGLLALGYHPSWFFASRFLGETLAVALLAIALASAARSRPGPGAGALAGFAALARPNLLPVPVLWAAGAGTWRRALLVLGGAALVVLPVTLRNLSASGHLVPVSGNAGITLFHGNGPGALGVYTPPEGFSGRADSQREEATRLASAQAGRALDPVEADGWWARRAVAARADDLSGSLALLGRRLGLLLDNREHGLDAAPSLDESPLRPLAPVPFALLLALAAASLLAPGWRESGGFPVWSALAVTAAMPVVFYASSRYRLPFASLLAVPAGVGAAHLLSRGPGWRRGAAAGLVAGVLSLAVPSAGLARAGEASALANRAAARLRAGSPALAERDAARAVALGPEEPNAWFNRAVVAEATGQAGIAEEAYRKAMALRPGMPEAAGNLGGFLVRTGRAQEAVPVLEEALRHSPDHAVCWTNLVVALAATRRWPEAREAMAAARSRGVFLHPDLVAEVEAGEVP